MKNKTHKSHASRRETVCGLEYDTLITKNYAAGRGALSNLRGHWRLVECKNCIAKRVWYEKRANRQSGM